MLAIGLGAFPFSQALVGRIPRDIVQIADSGLAARTSQPTVRQYSRQASAFEDDDDDLDDYCDDDDDDDDDLPGLPVPGKTTANDGKGLYYGCYTEAMRTLEDVQWNSETLTVDACAKFCQKDNWALFGVEYGGECFCGSKLKPPMSRAAETSCDMPCKGKSADICGGAGVISVWNNTAHVPQSNAPTAGSGKFAYAGCFTDSVAARAINAAYKGDDLMTVEMCGTFCAGKGFKFMGVEYGKECFCNNEGPVNNSVKVADGECKQVCAGDNAKFCGAPDRLTVYKTTA